MRLRSLALLTAVLVTASGCGTGDDWAAGPHPSPAPVGSLGPGFTDPSAPPTPAGTVTPAPGSWSGVRPSADYRVVLLTAGTDAPSAAVIDAVEAWADAEDVDLRTVDATAHHVDGIVEAIEMRPDLIVSAGNDLVDALAVVTASHLDRQFLVVGAELPEPTGNVTSVGWTGASFRGTGNGSATMFDPASFTPDRCAAAIRAGVAAVLHDVTGVVIWMDRF
ncbi:MULTISPECIES: type 1 periplasmic-binding domain-containing protein [Catenuloplanes]|uniref:BMP family ABC transporter substrate-binding protein n=1 Tax=Catenuloplanes niger TaxID=587534 RepID=A0AAE3ZJA7_9ACTN|nr:hypothetical protein [Catenuloplanes niger]MDR7320928.1 hypothetical protein [Catenuloplanes niger]